MTKINYEIFSIQRDSLERQKLFLKHDADRVWERTDSLCVRDDFIGGNETRISEINNANNNYFWPHLSWINNDAQKFRLPSARQILAWPIKIWVYATDSDASGSWGCGALQNTQWFQVEWSDQFKKEPIHFKKLMPIIFASLV